MTEKPSGPDQIKELRKAVADVQQQLGSMGTALAGLAGLDHVARGVAEVVEVLAPLRTLGTPPTPPQEPVAKAIERVRKALGPELRVDGVLVPDDPISYIGQPIYEDAQAEKTNRRSK